MMRLYCGVLLLCGLTSGLNAKTPDHKKAFSIMNKVMPDAQYDIRYFSDFNFVGKRINSYKEPLCILSHEAAKALKAVQQEVSTFGLKLQIYDCYRPQTAVNHFIAWARDLKDLRMKAVFYPFVEKSTLFKDGYIAEKSGHSRGSTIDLTLVSAKHTLVSTASFDRKVSCIQSQTKQTSRDGTLYMGTEYDCFDPRSHTANQNHNALALQNRLLLKSVMEKFGFQNYDKEWWHFTLINEPYPDRYFDFAVESW